MLNFNFLEVGLGIFTPTHSVYYFSIVSKTLYQVIEFEVVLLSKQIELICTSYISYKTSLICITTDIGTIILV